MSEATQSVSRCGALFFMWLGISGVILALFFVVGGFIQINSGRLLYGVGWLISGAIFSASTVRTLNLARETLAVTKRSRAGQ